jgi:hypothetical protein
MYLMNCFRFLLVSALLFTGHLPTLSKLVVKSVVALSYFDLKCDNECARQGKRN